MNLSIIKRLAAEVLGIGESRIYIDPSRLEEAASAITKDDVRKLIEDGVISIKPVKGTSRVRARLRHIKKRKGLRRGEGSRKGSRASMDKDLWIARVRALRQLLRYLRDKRMIDRKTYRRLYRMVKGGAFHSKSHLKAYIKEHGLLRRV
ncbi:MAG: 50S ribosomal protein L19e [Candidatus Nezhaarchaeota archaeon]|nr:50S ribosomal protein L19e [Candidatus Nezhaarchaeota archaeon]MCX8141758.1 50S ribosomal protein L19e [Candidatus Nezhaarchaeota archaeon]MDW8050464.1 50S ribosomal protein L19e [Nitrososphaerota archaeon]